MKKRNLSHLSLLVVLVGLAVASCSLATTPPGPDMAAGVYIGAGYEFFKWQEGLAVMLWHDAVASSGCDSSGSTDDPTHTVQCRATSQIGRSFNWQLKTTDGISAEFSINDQTYDLTQGALFIVQTAGEGINIQQLKRDLSGVSTESDSITGYGLRDPQVAEFIQATSADHTDQISVLKTQIAAQEQANQSQWDVISHLATQMPLAMGLITPGVSIATVTPTAYRASSTPTPFEDAPTLTPWLDIEYPPDTRTGIPEIDIIIDAIMDGLIEERIALVHLSEFPCTITLEALGGPPKCLDGEPEGKQVEVFPVLDTEGYHVRPENLTGLFDFTIRGLFAVYNVPQYAHEEDYYPAGKYAAVFTSEDGGFSHTITVHVRDGQIVRLDFSMEWPPFERVLDRSDSFILPPSTREKPTP